MRNKDIGSEQLLRFSVEFSLWTDRQSTTVWRAAGLCTLQSLLLPCTKPPSLPTDLLAPALVKAPGLLMQIKWWRGRGWGGEFARAQLLSTHTHSVQLLLLDQLRSVYKVPSIEEDKPTGYCTGCSPEQDVSQRLGPRVTWQETTCQTASVEEIYFTFSLLQLVLPAIRRQIIHMEKATTMTMGN